MLGKEPVVLVFATPALCQSRVCGPVVDVVDQVRADVGAGKAAFIHQEIYKDNKVNKGLRPQLLAWRLASEPWTFVIDRGARIAARFEGAVSVASCGPPSTRCSSYRSALAGCACIRRSAPSRQVHSHAAAMSISPPSRVRPTIRPSASTTPSPTSR